MACAGSSRSRVTPTPAPWHAEQRDDPGHDRESDSQLGIHRADTPLPLRRAATSHRAHRHRRKTLHGPAKWAFHRLAKRDIAPTSEVGIAPTSEVSNAPTRGAQRTKRADDFSFSLQMNSITSSSGMRRCVSDTVHGRVYAFGSSTVTSTVIVPWFLRRY